MTSRIQCTRRCQSIYVYNLCLDIYKCQGMVTIGIIYISIFKRCLCIMKMSVCEVKIHLHIENSLCCVWSPNQTKPNLESFLFDNIMLCVLCMCGDVCVCVGDKSNVCVYDTVCGVCVCVCVCVCV